VGTHGVTLHLETVGQRVLPERARPARQRVTAPERVDEQVEPPLLLLLDARHERGHLLDLGVVDTDGDPAATGGVDQLGRLVDALGALHWRRRLARGASRAVDGRTAGAELDGDAASRTPGRARNERDGSFEVSRHAVILPNVYSEMR